MSGLSRVGGFVACIVLAGVVGGVVWQAAAEPAVWTVVGDRLAMGEDAAAAEVSVVLTFVVVGLVASAVVGFALHWWWRPSWPAVLVIAGGLVASGFVAWQLGVAFGPPDPTSVTGLAEGDTVPDRLSLPNPLAPLLAWPMGGLAGVLLASFVERSPQERAIEATVPPVSDSRS